MNREDYRKAFDNLPFSPDFQERTVERLTQVCRETEKEENIMMKTKGLKKTMILVAAIVALLAVSASAVLLLLSPKDVASRLENPLLAEAFAGERAVLLNEVVETEGYTVTLAGMVSGEGLSSFLMETDGVVEADRSYVVLSLKKTDGMAMEELPSQLMFSPLVSGLPVRWVNAFSLSSSSSSFVEEGVAYYLFDTKNLEMFADRTVYMAMYEGSVPDGESFAMAEDGSISMTDKLTGPKALFTLPLNPAGADPEAVEQFMEEVSGGLYTED